MNRLPNNPRMMAASDVVRDSVKKYNLPPATEKAIEMQKASQLLGAVDNTMLMNRLTPKPAQVVPRKEQQVMEGLMGIAQRLAPGMQQRGRQMGRAGRLPAVQTMPQQQMARQMPQRPAPQQMQRPPMGGIAGLPAPNMARMQTAAQGGVIGFAAGGDPEIEQYIRLDEMFREYKAKGDMVSAANVKSEMELMEANNPSLRAEAMQQATRDAGFDPEVQLNLTPKVNKPGGKGKKPKMMGGGIVGYQPGGSVQNPSDIVAKMEEVRTSAPVAPSMEDEPLYQDLLGATQTGLGIDFAAEREAERKAAQEAYGMTPLERAGRDAVIKALEGYYGDIASPEEQRKLDREAILSSFMEPGSVVNVGQSLLKKRPERREQARRARLEQVTEPTKAALETMGLERETRGKAFEAGRETYQTLSAQRNQAMQTASQLLTGKLNREQTERLEGTRNQLNVLDASLRNALEASRQGRMDREDIRRALTDIGEMEVAARQEYTALAVEIKQNADFALQDPAPLIRAIKEEFDSQMSMIRKLKGQLIDVGGGSAGGTQTTSGDEEIIDFTDLPDILSPQPPVVTSP
jgi:hypothetical protein